MKRPTFDINYPFISAFAEFGNAPTTRVSITATEATKFPLRVSQVLSDQNVTWDVYAKISRSNYSGTDQTAADYGDNMVAYFDGRVLCTEGLFVTSDERIKTSV